MDPFIGQIQLFPYGFAPENWAICDGRLLQVNYYQSLYSLIGTKFGGDGIVSFGLPDLRHAVIGQHTQYYIAVYGIYPSRS